MIQDLVQIKNRLLRKHREYEMPNADDYRDGILSGITVALHTIDELMESESEKMAREFGEDEKS